MCLIINNTSSLVKPKTKTFYKVYKLADLETLGVRPVYYGKPFNVRKGLTLASNRKSSKVTNYESSAASINKGIHVTHTIAGAREICSSGTRVILKLECNPEDHVATGDAIKYSRYAGNQSVFTKVKIVDIVEIKQAYAPGQKELVKTSTQKLSKKLSDVFTSGVTIKV